MANILASERVRAGFSQKSLAKEIGRSEASVYRWESGLGAPDVPTLIRLHELFGCSVDYLLGLSDERKTVA